MEPAPFRLDLCSHAGAPIGPAAWLREWGADFPKEKYPALDRLLGKTNSLTAEDFLYLGRWKDGALESAKKWQPNVASVAFVIWHQAAKTLPGTRIEDLHLTGFLAEWSSKAYVDEFPTRKVQKRFGLARATTILHALSGGRWPIFDSRVRRAFKRITGINAQDDGDWYLSSYEPFFYQLVAACGTQDVKSVDNALFVYGRKKAYF